MRELMSQPGVSGGPGASGGPKRRSLPKPDLPSELGPRTLAMLSASHRMMMERLEEGLEAIEEAASSLMRDLAAEVWKASGGDGTKIQSRILEQLSRDQAIRGLIAHSDDRFQTLDLRVARIEHSFENVDKGA